MASSPSRSRMTAACMNAEDMNQSVFGSFYPATVLSKAEAHHTTLSIGAKAAKTGYFRAATKTRIVQFSRFGSPAEPASAPPAPAAAPPAARPGRSQASQPTSRRPDGSMPEQSGPG